MSLLTKIFWPTLPALITVAILYFWYGSTAFAAGAALGWILYIMYSVMTEESDKVIAGKGRVSSLSKSTGTIDVINSADAQKKFDCGHTGPFTFSLSIYGTEFGPFVGSEECADCVLEEAKEIAIRCALCGDAIVPGDPVALYYQGSPGLRLDIATKVDESAVGCLQMDCCPSGGFFAGHWTEQGFVPAFESGRNMVEESFATGEVIISNP